MSKIISYGNKNIEQKDINSVLKVLKSKYLTQGPLVKKFETDLKSKFRCYRSSRRPPAFRDVFFGTVGVST